MDVRTRRSIARKLAPRLLAAPLPGCSGHGEGDVPVPKPMAMTHLVRPDTPNTALGAHAGFTPSPNSVTRRYDVTPGALCATIRRVAATAPRTFPQVAYDRRMQADSAARNRIFDFPDLITVQVNPDSPLILWSRGVHGHCDFGVNKARLSAWLAAPGSALAHSAAGG